MPLNVKRFGPRTRLPREASTAPLAAGPASVTVGVTLIVGTGSATERRFGEEHALARQGVRGQLVGPCSPVVTVESAAIAVGEAPSRW